MKTQIKRKSYDLSFEYLNFVFYLMKKTLCSILLYSIFAGITHISCQRNFRVKRAAAANFSLEEALERGVAIACSCQPL